MKRVIVAVDFGAASDAALTYARVLARRHSSKLVLLHVLPVAGEGVVYGEFVAIPPTLLSRLESYQESRATKRLERKIEEFELGGLATEIRLCLGDIGEALLAEATEHDLIVVGANQRHLTRPGLAEEICRRSPCPVLACHAIDDDVGGKALFSRGLASVDGSQLAKDVAVVSARLIEPGGSLEFLHVIDPSLDHHVAVDVTGGSQNPDEASTMATAETVRAFEDWIENQELDVKTSGFIANDPPGEAMLARAVAMDADFIACGAHRKDEPGTLGLAELLVRHAPIPVLIVNG